jgi:hypothetical protein
MEFIQLICVLIEVTKAIFSFTEGFKNSKRKKEIAEWLHELGALIDNTASSLDQNNYPHNNCLRMRGLVDVFPHIFSDVFSKDKIEDLQNKMIQVTEIERMFGELSQLSPEDRRNNINELYEISSSFMVMSDTLKYSK